MRETYPAHLHQLGDHDNAEAVLLPNHPPEIVDHLLLGACGGGDTQQSYKWKSGNREEEEEKLQKERGRYGRKRDDNKSEKIAAITIDVQAVCNPCQGIE